MFSPGLKVLGMVKCLQSVALENKSMDVVCFVK